MKRRRWKRQKDWLDDILKVTVRDSLSQFSFVGGFRQPFWHTGFQHRDLVSFRHQNILFNSFINVSKFHMDFKEKMIFDVFNLMTCIFLQAMDCPKCQNGNLKCPTILRNFRE